MDTTISYYVDCCEVYIPTVCCGIINLVLTTIHFLHPVVDISAQSCTITPLNPPTLTDTGGALVSETTDVRIQCVCTGSSGPVRWYDINTIFLIRDNHMNYLADTPYYM